MPILGIFPTGGGVKSDEDNHASVCAFSSILTSTGEEERRKKNTFDSVEWNPILAFCHKDSRVEGKQEKII